MGCRTRLLLLTRNPMGHLRSGARRTIPTQALPVVASKRKEDLVRPRDELQRIISGRGRYPATFLYHVRAHKLHRSQRRSMCRRPMSRSNQRRCQVKPGHLMPDLRNDSRKLAPHRRALLHRHRNRVTPKRRHRLAASPSLRRNTAAPATARPAASRHRASVTR